MRKHPRIKILFSKNIINEGCLKNGLTIFSDRDRNGYKFRDYSATKPFDRLMAVSKVERAQRPKEEININ